MLAGGDPTTAILEILTVELRTSAERIARAASLKNELGFDSIAAANATFAIEDLYGIEIEIQDDDPFDTLADIVELVRRALTERR